jgi:hypothetical protein
MLDITHLSNQWLDITHLSNQWQLVHVGTKVTHVEGTMSKAGAQVKLLQGWNLQHL